MSASSASASPPTPLPALQGVGELLAYVPYQLGFTPTDSLALVMLEHGRMLGVVRFDLFDDHDTARSLPDVIDRSRARTMTDAIAIGYGRADRATACLDLTRQALEDAGRPISHLVVVDGTRWHAVRCSCTSCPVHPAALPDISTAPVAVEALVRGAQPQQTRSDVERLSEPTTAERFRAKRIAATAADDPVVGRPPAAWSAIARLVAGEQSVADLPDRDLLRASRSLIDVVTRDVLLAWAAPDAFPPRLLPDGVRPLRRAARRAGLPERPRAAVGRLLRWANSVPPELAVPIWSVIGAHEWARGGGALAGIALDRALTTDPDYALAHLVATCLERGVLPAGQP